MKLRASSLSVLLLVSCGGGGGAAPKAADPESVVSADAGERSVAREGDAAPAPVPSAAPEPADPGSSGPSAETKPAEPVDECTPVGVDYEKRARPKLKECYREGKKKDPQLEGTVKLSVDIDTLGKVRSTKIVEKTMPDAVAQCMLKALKATPLPEAAKCPGKAITIPVTFPTPR